MEIPDAVLAGRAVLVIWHGGNATEVLQPLVEELRGRVGVRGSLSLENVERLAICEWGEARGREEV